ncbi:hypothetical protein CASFOL_003795 [Castilleja foliolosa]|uniref:AD domain-containing protein n=1 Tax=Castilleja foliolosa TaxID=1961234 RepID=A0ABD3ELK0_9LAMI
MDAQVQDEEFAVGCILSIKTTLGEEFQAQVIAFDRTSNLLFLNSSYGDLQEGVKSGAGPKRDIRLLKANYIKEFTFLGQGEDPLDANKCVLDLNTLQSREESAIRQAEADAERIGVGVTAEAQRLFEALSKTGGSAIIPELNAYSFLALLFLLVEGIYLPVRWEKTTIIVMNEVRVGSPYLPESVFGGTPAANERVRKVLEFEKKRLQSRTLG